MVTMAQKINMAAKYRNLNQSQLAVKLGMSPACFSRRLQTGKFSVIELNQIAEVLDCEYMFGFKFRDGANF
jgi:DNA-binding Xre family transcriptional regulator